MRIHQREVTRLNDIFEILTHCDTVHLAINDDKYPYLVPVSFGAELIDEHIAIYFHSAMEGMKVELLERNPHVCVEADRFFEYTQRGKSLDTCYESVIGFGECVELTNDADRLHGLNLICEHCGFESYEVSECSSLPRTKVFKVVLKSVTGKRHA